MKNKVRKTTERGEKSNLQGRQMRPLEKVWRWLWKNKLPLVIGVGIYVYALVITLNVSGYDYQSFGMSEWGRWVINQLVFAVLDFLAVFYVRKVVAEAKNGNEYYKNLLKYCGVALAINVVLLLLIWPGYWVSDEMGVLASARKFEYFTWQSYLTVMYYSVCMMLIPSAVGVVIVQTVFVSVVFGYFINVLRDRTKTKWVAILYLVLLLPPVICNDFYPLRITMNTYIELLMITWVYKKYLMAEKLSWGESILMGGAFSLLVLWRSEGMYYLLAPLIVFWFLGRGEIWKKCLLMYGIMILLTGGYTYMNQKLDAVHVARYKATAYINPLSTMLKDGVNIETSSAEVEELGELMNLENVEEEASYDNIPAFLKYQETLFSEKYYQNPNLGMKAFIKLALKNPGLYLKNRALVYWKTNTARSAANTILDYNKEEMARLGDELMGAPINGEVRRGVLGFLRDDKDAGIYAFWNTMPVTVGVVILTVVLIIKRKWLAAIMVGSLLVRAGIVFLTAPAVLFMYYFPLYLEGILFVGGAVISVVKYRQGVLHEKNKD